MKTLRVILLGGFVRPPHAAIRDTVSTLVAIADSKQPAARIAQDSFNRRISIERTALPCTDRVTESEVGLCPAHPLVSSATA